MDRDKILDRVRTHTNPWDIIVIGGEDRIPYLYMMDRPRNLKVGEEATLIRKLEAQEGAIFALDWSLDGRRIAVAGASTVSMIWAT